MTSPEPNGLQLATQQLAAAAAAVDGVRVYTDPGATVDPPGVVVAPPSIQFEGFVGGPTTARFLLYVVVAADERALERLYPLVMAVAAAIDEHTAASVLEASPGSWGTPELPAYVIETEYSL